MIQRTLVLLKPDALDRGIIGDIISRFERIGLTIVGMKLLISEADTARQHYTEDLAKRRGEKVREMMLNMITMGPIVAIALEGVGAIAVVRKHVGTTEPAAAAPGTIRGDYAHVSFEHADQKNIGLFNLIHASSDEKDAETELGVWFRPEELVEYAPQYTKHTIAK